MNKSKRYSRKRKGTVSAQRTDDSLNKQIREVGPNSFGLLVVDSGKRHFAVRLTNFFGDALWEPEPVRSNRVAVEAMIAEVEKQLVVHGLERLVVGIERTGRWHEPIKQMLEKKWPVKMIHPFTTKQLRQPASSGVKTDPVDLTAMQRAMICGYGSREPELPEEWLSLRLLSRMRSDLAAKRASRKTQSSGLIEALLPGYTELFDDLWKNSGPVAVIKTFPSAERLLQSDTDRIMMKLSGVGVRCQRSTVDRIRSWASQAPPADPGASVKHRILSDYLTLVDQLTVQIDRCEVDLLKQLVQTPAVLLLSITGVNVVSAAEYGAEMGPHEHYIGPKNVTGRAGLFPGRMQSDETDIAGPVVAGRNTRLRNAIRKIGHNLVTLNPYFRGRTLLPDRKKRDHKLLCIEAGQRFVRISFTMLREKQTFNHPIAGRQDSVLCKLIAFAREKGIAANEIYDIAEKALEQVQDRDLDFERRALLCNGWNGRLNSPRPNSRPQRRNMRKPEYVIKLVAELEQRLISTKGVAVNLT